MSRAATASAPNASSRGLGTAWIGMWLAFALHVADEALTGFLSIYNPTVIALHTRFDFWHMPPF